MSRVFSHLALMQCMCLPPGGPDPQSRLQRELMMPPVGSGFDHMYQVVIDQWEKEALASQTACFPPGSSPNFSYRVWEAGILTQLSEFAHPHSVQGSYAVRSSSAGVGIH